MGKANNIRQNYIQAGYEAKERIHEMHERMEDNPSACIGGNPWVPGDFHAASRINHIQDPGKSNFKTGTMFVGSEPVDETLGTMYEGQIGRSTIKE